VNILEKLAGKKAGLKAAYKRLKAKKPSESSLREGWLGRKGENLEHGREISRLQMELRPEAIRSTGTDTPFSPAFLEGMTRLGKTQKKAKDSAKTLPAIVDEIIASSRKGRSTHQYTRTAKARRKRILAKLREPQRLEELKRKAALEKGRRGDSAYEKARWAANVTEGAGNSAMRGKQGLWRPGKTKARYEKRAARAGIDKLFYSPATTKVESLLRYARGNPAKKEILKELEATYGKNRALWPKASGSSTPQQKLVEGRRRAALTSLMRGKK